MEAQRASVEQAQLNRDFTAITSPVDGVAGLAKAQVDAALEGARLRLRPIIMTSFAFILGCVPLWRATGSGAVARRIMGTTVIGWMLAATLIAIFLIPVMHYTIQKFADRRQEHVVA